jgi:hypothetical protein
MFGEEQRSLPERQEKCLVSLLSNRHDPVTRYEEYVIDRTYLDFTGAIQNLHAALIPEEVPVSVAPARPRVA